MPFYWCATCKCGHLLILKYIGTDDEIPPTFTVSLQGTLMVPCESCGLRDVYRLADLQLRRLPAPPSADFRDKF